jgi:hypothetical protein
MGSINKDNIKDLDTLSGGEHLIVQQKPEIWVTDDIAITFKNTDSVRIDNQVTLDIIERASSLLRTLETVKRYEGDY